MIRFRYGISTPKSTASQYPTESRQTQEIRLQQESYLNWSHSAQPHQTPLDFSFEKEFSQSRIHFSSSKQSNEDNSYYISNLQDIHQLSINSSEMNESRHHPSLQKSLQIINKIEIPTTHQSIQTRLMDSLTKQIPDSFDDDNLQKKSLDASLDSPARSFTPPYKSHDLEMEEIPLKASIGLVNDTKLQLTDLDDGIVKNDNDGKSVEPKQDTSQESVPPVLKSVHKSSVFDDIFSAVIGSLEGKELENELNQSKAEKLVNSVGSSSLLEPTQSPVEPIISLGQSIVQTDDNLDRPSTLPTVDENTPTMDIQFSTTTISVLENTSNVNDESKEIVPIDLGSSCGPALSIDEPLSNDQDQETQTDSLVVNQVQTQSVSSKVGPDTNVELIVTTDQKIQTDIQSLGQQKQVQTDFVHFNEIETQTGRVDLVDRHVQTKAMPVTTDISTQTEHLDCVNQVDAKSVFENHVDDRILNMLRSEWNKCQQKIMYDLILG